MTRHFSWLSCLVCFLIGVAAVGWPAIADNGFPLDDSWIHQTIGRNAAQYGVPGFAPRIASSGSTSALWPWIIAINYRLMPEISPVAYVLVFNGLCLLIILATLYSLAKHDGLSASEAALFAGLAALTGNLVWLISTGMEHLLSVALLFGACACWLHPRRNGSGPSLAAGVLYGLAILTRPEAMALVPLFALAGALAGRSRKELLSFFLTVAAATSLLALNNWWVSHSFSLLPGTFAGRRWLAAPQHSGLAATLIQAARFGRDSIVHIVRYVLGINVGDGATAAIALLAAAAAAAGIVRLVRRKAWRLGFLTALAAVNFAIYSVMLPTVSHGMRYHAIALVFVFPLIAFGLRALMDRLLQDPAIPERWRRGCQYAVTSAVAALALLTLVRWNRITDAGIQHINGTHVLMGQWLARHLPAGTPVASFDIGAVGYFSGATVVDLGGLTDPEVLPYLYAKQVPAYLRARGVRWVVLPVQPTPEGEAPDDSCERTLSLCSAAGLTKEKIVSFTSPYSLWVEGEQATWNAAQSQWLYKVTWR